MSDASVRSHALAGLGIPSAAVAMIALVLAVAPRDAAALSGLLLVCGAALVLGLMRISRARTLTRADGLLLAACGAPVALALVTSAFADNVRVSFAGLVGQHGGSLMWLAAFALFTVSFVSARPADMGAVMRAIGLLSAPIALAAALEWLGVIPGSAYSAPPSGVMENPGSLGQLLVVCLMCATGWAISVPRERPLAIASAVVALGGLFVAASEGAWLGLIIGLIAAVGVSRMVARGRRVAMPLAVVTMVLALAAAGAFVWMAILPATDFESSDLVGALHDRGPIWRSAVMQVAQAPLLGSGAEQYSAWVSWDSVPGKDLTHVATYDPHNVLLWWALATGIAGAALALTAAVALGAGMARAVASRPGPVTASVVGAAVGWATAVMLTWTSPIALGALALLLGTALAATRHGEPDEGTGGTPILAAGLSAATLVLLALVALGTPHEYVWAGAARGGPVPAGVLASAAEATGDPSYRVMMLGPTVAMSAADEASVAAAAEALSADAVWHVDAAFSALTMVMGGSAGAEPQSLQLDLDRAVTSAAHADPASGLWTYTAAVFADGVGMTDEADRYSTDALAMPLPAGVRSYLEAREGEPAP